MGKVVDDSQSGASERSYCPLSWHVLIPSYSRSQLSGGGMLDPHHDYDATSWSPIASTTP